MPYAQCKCSPTDGHDPAAMTSPPNRTETARQRLRDALSAAPLTARELSQKAGLAEKEVIEHLSHLAQSLAHSPTPLGIVPARCRACGFLFEARPERARPGRCPKCKHERIQAARFGVGRAT